MSFSPSSHNQQTLRELMDRIGYMLEDKMRSVLIRENIPAHIDPRDNIYDSIKHELDDNVLRVGSDSLHAPYVEYGRMPGKAPPFDPIHEWVRVKLGLQEPDATSAAWAIVNKIKNEGIEPTRFMYKSVFEFVQEVSKQ